MRFQKNSQVITPPEENCVKKRVMTVKDTGCVLNELRFTIIGIIGRIIGKPAGKPGCRDDSKGNKEKTNGSKEDRCLLRPASGKKETGTDVPARCQYQYENCSCRKSGKNGRKKHRTNPHTGSVRMRFQYLPKHLSCRCDQSR